MLRELAACKKAGLALGTWAEEQELPRAEHSEQRDCLEHCRVICCGCGLLRASRAKRDTPVTVTKPNVAA